MPSFNLTKEDGKNKFNLSKSGLTRALIGLGWDVPDVAGQKFDLDASAFGLVNVGGAPKFYNDGSHAAFYGNTGLKQPDGSFLTADGSMKHYGDNRTGVGDGDDEKIEVDFSKLPKEIVEISIFVTIHEAAARGQDFSMVKNSFIRVVNVDSGEELCRYQLKESFAGAAAVQVGSLVKENDQWVFKAVGAGSKATLNDVLTMYS